MPNGQAQKPPWIKARVTSEADDEGRWSRHHGDSCKDLYAKEYGTRGILPMNVSRTHAAHRHAH